MDIIFIKFKIKLEFIERWVYIVNLKLINSIYYNKFVINIFLKKLYSLKLFTTK